MMFKTTKNKKAQEEMIGFVLIVVLVAVIGLIFLKLSLDNSPKEAVDSFEVESFIQSFLQYTTDCGNYRENYLPLRKLISACVNEETCLDTLYPKGHEKGTSGRYSCDVLNSTLTEIIETSWKVEGDRPIQGYELKIVLEDGTDIIPMINKGNVTKNFKGVSQPFTPLRENYKVDFTVYY